MKSLNEGRSTTNSGWPGNMQSGQINESGRAGIQSLRFQRGQLEFGVVELGRQSLNRGGERREREREREGQAKCTFVYSAIHSLGRNVLLRFLLKVEKACSEGSFNIGPPARGISQFLIFETLRQSG